MKKLIIPSGQIPKGKVKVSGAKNSATRLMCAAILSNEETLLRNFPTELVDARNKARFLNDLNIETAWNEDNDELKLNASKLKFPEKVSYDVPVRTTYLLAAAQLARFGEAKIPYPGGCKLGERKYDLHILVWERFGCEVIELEDYIHIKADSGKLKACEITFPITTIGGTENAILCASTIEAKSTFRNAYVSPEVQDLIAMLIRMGVKIEILGSSTIEIVGNKDLKGVNYDVMPDRIEALTWLTYGILSSGDILIEDVPFQAMEIPLIHVNSAGIDFFRNRKDIYVNKDCIDENGIQPFELACGTHPGIISDMQPFYVLLALKANGKSLIVDYRYPERVAYLNELNRFLDKKITFKTGQIITDGPVKFSAAQANSTDLRGSMAVIMAGLLAENGVSEIDNPYLALRGYNKLVQKLNKLGVNVEI